MTETIIKLVISRETLSYTTQWPLETFSYGFLTEADLDASVKTYLTNAGAAKGFEVTVTEV